MITIWNKQPPIAWYKLLTDKEEYQKMAKAHSPYGNGMASQSICKVLEEVKLWSYQL